MLKKIIILLSLIFLFSSCEKVEENILEEKNISENFSEEKEKILEEKKIIWDENIKFSKCDDLSSYKDDKNWRDKFNNTDEISILTKKIESDFEWWPYSHPDFYWYCKSEDWKYIFWFNSLFSIQTWRYDENLDVMEFSDLDLKSIHYVDFPWHKRHRNYWDISLEKYYSEYAESKKTQNWFWRKNWNIISFSVYWQWMTWQAESAPWFFDMWKGKFLSEKNVKYCDTWLTKWWKLSVCFNDTFYDYNFVENKLIEKKFCSYYVNDNWEIKVLESCKELK